MNESRFRKSALAVAVAALLLSACGSGSEGNSAASDTTSPDRLRNAALVSTAPVSISQVTAVAAGYRHTLALTDGKTIFQWGDSRFKWDNAPKLHPEATKFVQVVAGAYANAALDDTGRLYTWGSSVDGVDDPLRERAPKTLTDSALRFTSIHSGFVRMSAIDTEGVAHIWGYKINPEIGMTRAGNNGAKLVKVSATHVFGASLDENGNVDAWGDIAPNFGSSIKPTNGATKIVDLESSTYGVMTLDDLGKLTWWPHAEAYSPLFTPIPELPSGAKFISFDVGGNSATAADDQGNVYSWPNAEYAAVPSPIKSAPNGPLTKLSLFLNHVAGIDDEGNLSVWGVESAYLPLPQVFGEKAPVMPIAAGGRMSFGIDEDGAISQFDSSGDACCAPEEGSYIQVAAGVRHALALDRFGKVSAWGDWTAGQTNVPWNLNSVVQIAAGYSYSSALKSDGTVVEWGSHVSSYSSVINKPEDLSKVVAISGGLTHVLALLSDGSVVGWGDNSFEKATVPEDVKNIVSIGAGYSCSVALAADGKLFYWGACTEKMTAVASVENAKSISVAEQNVIVVKNDGTLEVWGEDWSELNKVPEAAKDIVAVSASYSHALAVTSTGNVIAWGDIAWGNTVIPPSFGGIDPNIPGDGEYGNPGEGQGPGEPYVYTEEDIAAIAGMIQNMTPEQRAKIAKLIGFSVDAVTSPEQLTSVAEKLASEKTAVLAALNSPEAAAIVAPVTPQAAVLPAAQSPGTKIGTKVSTKKAVSILGLKKVTKVSFVVPKKSASSGACSITKTTVTAKAAGTCIVKVKYTDAKKKAKSTSLTLMIG